MFVEMEGWRLSGAGERLTVPDLALDPAHCFAYNPRILVLEIGDASAFDAFLRKDPKSKSAHRPSFDSF
jgi:hypothetical protein